MTIERIDIKPEMIELIKEVLKQNRLILEQNGELLSFIASPPLLMTEDVWKDGGK